MTTTEAPAKAPAEVRTATMAATDFIRAFTNAALFACTDDTLPSICAVRLHQDTPGEITFEATNRYVASQERVDLIDREWAATHNDKAQDAPKPETALDVMINAKAGTALAKTIKGMLSRAQLAYANDAPKVIVSWDGEAPNATLTLADNLSPDVALPAEAVQGEFPKGIPAFFTAHRTERSRLCKACRISEAGNPQHREPPLGREPYAWERASAMPHAFDPDDEPETGKFQDWAISPAWLSALCKVVPAEQGYGRSKVVEGIDFSFGYPEKPVMVTIGGRFRAMVMPWRKAR